MNLIGLKNNIVVSVCNVYPDDFDAFVESNPGTTYIENTFPNAEMWMELVSGELIKGDAYTEQKAADQLRMEAESLLASQKPQKITKLAFRNRFTSAEKVALEIASLDVASAPMPARAMAAALRSSQADLALAAFVDLSFGDTIAGVQMLESAGLLSNGRADEILTAPVLKYELFKA